MGPRVAAGKTLYTNVSVLSPMKHFDSNKDTCGVTFLSSSIRSGLFPLGDEVLGIS